MKEHVYPILFPILAVVLVMVLTFFCNWATLIEPGGSHHFAAEHTFHQEVRRLDPPKVTAPDWVQVHSQAKYKITEYGYTSGIKDNWQYDSMVHVAKDAPATNGEEIRVVYEGRDKDGKAVSISKTHRVRTTRPFVSNTVKMIGLIVLAVAGVIGGFLLGRKLAMD